MKVIFLDIDGVLNSENHAKELDRLAKEGKMSKREVCETWDLPYEGTLLPLKKIVDETGAKIVLSSCWRINPANITKLNKIFEPYGFQIMDITTTGGVTATTLKKLGFDISIAYDKSEMWNGKPAPLYTDDRGAQIALWLRKHPEVDSFVILDDDCLDIDQYYGKQHVWTDFYDWALTFEKAEQAIRILNGGKKDG